MTNQGSHAGKGRKYAGRRTDELGAQDIETEGSEVIMYLKRC